MDRLKDFIDENKSQFEEQNTNQDVIWENIQMKQNPKKRSWNTLLKVAAVGILLVGLGFFLGQLQIRKQTNSMITSIEQKELYKLDHFYGNLLADQVNLIHKNETITQTDKDELFNIIDQMEVDYAELKIELENNINNDYILDEIITNYKKRLQLLERLNNRIPSKIENNNEQYINL